jgi:hypothetical protein
MAIKALSLTAPRQSIIATGVLFKRSVLYRYGSGSSCKITTFGELKSHITLGVRSDPSLGSETHSCLLERSIRKRAEMSSTEMGDLQDAVQAPHHEAHQSHDQSQQTTSHHQPPHKRDQGKSFKQSLTPLDLRFPDHHRNGTANHLT